MFFPFHDDNPTQRTPLLTWTLIAVNVASFLWVGHLSKEDREQVAYQRGFVPARLTGLKDHKAVAVPAGQRLVRDPLGKQFIQQRRILLPPEPRPILLSLLSCMFLHGGWMHLIGNMWFLWIFGNNVEDRLGSVPFLLLYVGGGLVASGCHWMTDPNSVVPVIGASGAVATILGAYAITWPWARIHTVVLLFVIITIIDLPALLVLGFWFVAQLLAGRDALVQGADGGVAWWAHVGGFVAGLILMPLFSMALGVSKPPKNTRAPQ